MEIIKSAFLMVLENMTYPKYNLHIMKSVSSSDLTMQKRRRIDMKKAFTSS